MASDVGSRLSRNCSVALCCLDLVLDLLAGLPENFTQRIDSLHFSFDLGRWLFCNHFEDFSDSDFSGVVEEVSTNFEPGFC